MQEVCQYFLFLLKDLPLPTFNTILYVFVVRPCLYVFIEGSKLVFVAMERCNQKWHNFKDVNTMQKL